MAQFQILEYDETCGIIVQIPKSDLDKIVSPPVESVLFFYLPSEEFKLTASTQQAHMKPHG